MQIEGMVAKRKDSIYAWQTTFLERSAIERQSQFSEGAAFALYGLLLTFTFSGAPSLRHARTLIREEANAISDAYKRVDLVAPDQQAPLRDLFRKYLDARLAAY